MFKNYTFRFNYLYHYECMPKKHSPKVKICKRETHEYQALIRQTLTKQNFRKREKNKGGYLCRTLHP